MWGAFRITSLLIWIIWILRITALLIWIVWILARDHRPERLKRGGFGAFWGGS